MTLAEAIEFCRHYLRDPNGRIWSDTLITKVIDEAMSFHFVRHKGRKAVYESRLATDNTYALPSSAFEIEAVMLNGNFLTQASNYKVETMALAQKRSKFAEFYQIIDREAKAISLFPVPYGTIATGAFAEITGAVAQKENFLTVFCARTTPELADLSRWQAEHVLFNAISKLHLHEQGGKSITLFNYWFNRYQLADQLEKIWEQKKIKLQKHQVTIKTF